MPPRPPFLCSESKVTLKCNNKEPPRWLGLQRKHSHCFPSQHPVVIMFHTLDHTHKTLGSGGGLRWDWTTNLSSKALAKGTIRKIVFVVFFPLFIFFSFYDPTARNILDPLSKLVIASLVRYWWHAGSKSPGTWVANLNLLCWFDILSVKA